MSEVSQPALDVRHDVEHLIHDPIKAEYMAYASKDSEERVVRYANEAVNYAEHAETTDIEHGDIDRSKSERFRDGSLLRAQEFRNRADQEAEQAADAFDNTNGTNQTAYELAQALKSGKSVPYLRDQIQKDKETKRLGPRL